MRLVIQAYFYLPSYIITSFRLKDEQNMCSNETAEINIGHGHSVALFSTHVVSRCPCHPSVYRYQLRASSVGMWHFALVPFPCQVRAEGAQGSCLAPPWLSWVTLQHSWGCLSPGRAAPAQVPQSCAPHSKANVKAKELVPASFK